MPDPRAIADYMDSEVCCRLEAGDDVTELKGVSEVLIQALEPAGIEGRSVLDVGCGAGGLALELLRRGATTATGIDLSPQAIAAARDAAKQEGMAGRTTFRVGDGAEEALEPADVVVLNKVYCCYFDPTNLVHNTLPVAERVYAMVLPISEGIRGVASRLWLGVENLWHLLRRRGFRAYVHDVPELDEQIRARGFRIYSQARYWLWDVRVYVR
ncbi:MAG: methyltransferase domain-containing protein [Nitriliruptorales bacterium]|nr:methyltransferase domain-containing protein [Nitriliruptorales bacterium]